MKPFMSTVDLMLDITETQSLLLGTNQQTSLSPLGTAWSLEQVETEMKSVLKKFISIGDDEPIDNQMSFFDMGLDSLGATEFTSMLQTSFKVEILSTTLFSYPTISDLSSHLHSILAPEEKSNDTLSAQILTASPSSKTKSAGVSIVGTSCHFPGDGCSPLKYWELLYNGTDNSSYIPFGRWDTFCLAYYSNN